MDLGNAMNGGFLSEVPPNATPAVQISRLNDIIRKLNNQLKSQVFSDGTNQRFVQGFAAGRWPDGNFGIAISELGKDVLTCDFTDLIFAWDFSTNKQYIRGGTQYWYDATTGINYMQVGTLPDGDGGEIIAKPGFNVDDIYG